MTDTALDFLLTNLKDLIVHNYELIHGVKDEVDALYHKLGMLDGFLKEATRRQINNEIIRTTVNRVREVVYDIEDTVDTYVTKVALHKPHKLNPVKAVRHASDLRKLGEKIMSMKTTVDQLIKTVEAFGTEPLRERDGSTGTATRRQDPIVEEENVVGIRDQADKIIELLTSKSQDLEVISIVGMPGLGKTTLAKMISRDPRVVHDFYGHVWVHVSQECIRKDVFLKILSHFGATGDDVKEMDDDGLAKKVHEVLSKERYLIFTDDVWYNTTWDSLKIAFPNKKNGSRILLTTRDSKVANHAKINLKPHNMRRLNDDESWDLLKWKALRYEECSKELETYGKHIAERCKGLPLALVVLGGILRDNNNAPHWWSKVAKRVEAYVGGDYKIVKEGTMDYFIEMSFNQLSYNLRSCFLYFGVFPQEFKIPVWKLVCLWIAEGFIEESTEKSLEDTAEEYLEELVSRNLVMVEKWRSSGRIKTCHVHDMLHVFCRNKAVEEKLFQEIKHFDPSKSLPSQHTLEKCRRLCVHSNVESYLSSNPVGPKVRSFLCFCTNDFDLDPVATSSIPKISKLLRVFEGKAMYFPHFTVELSQLIHLKHLVISCSYKFLPKDFSSLRYLQTLAVQTSTQTFEIKANLWKMKKLRLVKTNISTSLPLPDSPIAKKGKDVDYSLINGDLIALSMISPTSCTQDVFARAPNLKKLGICGQIAQLSDSFDCLGTLKDLENLKLLNDVSCQEKIVKLPNKNQFPIKLNKLTLANTRLDWTYMSTLGMLNRLEILKLRDNAFDGESWRAEEGGFLALKVLHIGRTNLKTWEASSRVFPGLKSLYIEHCSDLKAIPFSLADVSSLQIMDLHRTTKTAVASALEIQQHKKAMQTNNGKEFQLSIFPPDYGKLPLQAGN